MLTCFLGLVSSLIAGSAWALVAFDPADPQRQAIDDAVARVHDVAAGPLAIHDYR